MMCPSCGRDARSGDVFCASCGHELAPPTCPRCAAVSRAGARFCVSCGAALGEAAGAPSTPPSSPATAAAGPSVRPEEDPGVDEDPGPPLWEARLAPAAGLPARNEPDAAAQVTGELAPDTRLVVLEEREPWARVSIESGWSGWVEARRLVDPDLPAARAEQHDGSSRG